MKNLNKNILRYAIKNKFSLGGLFVLFSISMSSLTTLGLLSKNFSGTYETVIKNGNQHNIVINELYSSSVEGENNKQELLESLTSNEAIKNNLNVRRFEGLTIQSSPENQSKVIKYEPKYPSQYNENNQWYIPTVTDNTIPTDNLQVYLQTGLPYLEANYLDKVQKFYHLPSSIDFTSIVNYVTSKYSVDLVGKVSELNPEDKRILYARQAIVYFLAKGENSEPKYKNFLSSIINSGDVDVSNVDPKSSSDLSKVFKQFFDNSTSNNDYNAPIISGSGISFQEITTSLIPGIPAIPKPVIRFEDYNSRICVVPPALLTHQNKKVYSYEEFIKNCNSMKNTNFLYNESTIEYTEFDKYFNNIPSEYKVKVDSIDYLIVGAGITPDFFYPIVSFENTVVDFKHELTLYTNDNGFKRTQHSFQSSPLESLLLVKYSGKQNLNTVINELNSKAEKYLSFPLGTINTYAANDTNNTFSPTAARVQFIEQLVLIVDSLTVILSIFLTIITLFIVVIVLSKFISENKKTLYILVAQGISKARAISSIILLPLFPCLLAAIFSYLLAHFTQANVFSIFSAYWPLEIYTRDFSIFIMLGIFLAFYIITSIVAFILGIRSLKSSVSSGITVSSSKLGPLAIAVKKPFAKFNVVTRFRVSLAFGSFSKLIFLSLSVFLFIFTLSFISSTINVFPQSLATVTKTNQSTMQMNLVTPTRNGGQYYGVTFDQAGQLFRNPNNPDDILNPPAFANVSSGYGKYYSDPIGNNIPLFRDWSNMLLISANDGERQEQELRYMANVSNWEFMMNIKVLSTTNPWTDIVSPLLPSNQKNASSQFLIDLYSKLLSDNRIIKTSDDTISSKAFDKTTIFSPTYKELISTFYIVNNDYSNDFIKSDETPIIKLDSNENLSEFSENDINSLLSNYGNVFSDTLSSNSFKFNFDSDLDAIKVDFENSIPILTSRNLFKSFFESLSKQEFTVYDQILDEYKNNFNNSSSRIFSGSSLTPAFLNYVIYILTTPDYQKYIYKNSYNLSIINENDEAYTYVNASFINPDTGELFDKFDSNYQYKNEVDIIGIQENSKFINLVNENNESINHKLFDSNITYVNGREDLFPLIPNLYAKRLYNLKIGDEIKIFATNNVDRYNPNLINKNNDNTSFNFDYHKQYLDGYTRTYKIVDFANSTKDAEFYTSMSSAQKTIGLSYKNNGTLELPNNIDNNIISNIYPSFEVNKNFSLINEFNRFGGFNGVFSSDDLIGVTNEVTLYSPSGLYPGTSEISTDVVVIKKLINYNLFNNKSNEQNLEILANALYLTTEQTQEFKNDVNIMKTKSSTEQDLFVDNVINQLSNIYRKTVFFSMIDTPSSVQATVSTFSNLTALIDNVEIIVASLISILSLIVLIVTSWIIIKDLMQLISLLKVQGVSDWNNALNILSIFFPTWILAGILTMPALFGALCLFENTVFVSMGLVISAPINWVGFLLTFIGVGIFLAFLLWLANIYIKKINLVESLKW